MENFTWKGHTFSYEMTVITPEMAQAWLNKADGTNRPRKKRKVRQYHNDIKAGNFPPGDSNILIAPDGTPINGLNRLTAIAMGDIPVAQMVFYDYPKEWRVHLDQGSPRTAGDYLHYNGAPNARITATGVKRYMSLVRGATIIRTEGDRAADSSFSISEIVSTYEQFKDDFDFATNVALQVSRDIPLQTGSIIGIVAFLKIQRNHEDVLIENFFLDLAGKRDVVVDINSNIGQLKALLMQENDNKRNNRKALPAKTIQNKMIYVWNHCLRNERIPNLSTVSGLRDQILD